MSDLQKEILNMVIIFNDETLLSIKTLLENLLDNELLTTLIYAVQRGVDVSSICTFFITASC